MKKDELNMAIMKAKKYDELKKVLEDKEQYFNDLKAENLSKEHDLPYWFYINMRLSVYKELLEIIRK